MGRYDYHVARTLVQITGIVFCSQAILEWSGAIARKPGFWWVVPACGAAFGLSIAYALTLVLLNSRKRPGA